MSAEHDANFGIYLSSMEKQMFPKNTLTIYSSRRKIVNEKIRPTEVH